MWAGVFLTSHSSVIIIVRRDFTWSAQWTRAHTGDLAASDRMNGVHAWLRAPIFQWCHIICIIPGDVRCMSRGAMHLPCIWALYYSRWECMSFCIPFNEYLNIQQFLCFWVSNEHLIWEPILVYYYDECVRSVKQLNALYLSSFLHIQAFHYQC